jgi:cystathionine gamma-synthase
MSASTTRPDDPATRLHPATTAIGAGRGTGAAGQPLNVPLIAASTFRAGSTSPSGATGPTGPTGAIGAAAAREYARDDATAAWEALEEVVAELEAGACAVTFSSGMAVAAAVLDLLPVGARIVAPSDSYTGVRGLLADGQRKGRWDVELVDITDTEAVLRAMSRADLSWLESPTNPLLEVADLPALCAAERPSGALVAVDNTFATPLLQQPLSAGADIVVHSATKFIGGHSDLLLGVAVAGSDALGGELRERRMLAGATPGSLETFLALRGIRTMPLRLEQGQRTAAELARRLDGHAAVTRVRYPGLPGDPGHARATAQMNGYGAILAFELPGAEAADRVCDTVRVIHSATSVGGVESTIERRAKLPGQEHVPAGLLRLSVGCEFVEDLWRDLSQALDDLTA